MKPSSIRPLRPWVLVQPRSTPCSRRPARLWRMSPKSSTLRDFARHPMQSMLRDCSVPSVEERSIRTSFPAAVLKVTRYVGVSFFSTQDPPPYLFFSYLAARCSSTLLPCVEPNFNECPSCRRCSILLLPGGSAIAKYNYYSFITSNMQLC